MKKYFLFIIILSFIGITEAQNNIPITRETIVFASDSISSSIVLGKNEFLAGIFVPSGITSRLYFQVYQGDSLGYCFLQDGGGAKYYATVDSTINAYVPLPPLKFLTAKTLKVVIWKDPTSSKYMYLEKRPF